MFPLIYSPFRFASLSSEHYVGWKLRDSPENKPAGAVSKRKGLRKSPRVDFMRCEVDEKPGVTLRDMEHVDVFKITLNISLSLSLERASEFTTISNSSASLVAWIFDSSYRTSETWSGKSEIIANRSRNSNVSPFYFAYPFSFIREYCTEKISLRRSFSSFIISLTKCTQLFLKRHN